MSLTVEQQMLVEQRVTNEGPSKGVAYLLWLFTGLLSGHRWYLGRPGTAMLQIALNLIIVGWIWTFLDAFMIPGMIREKQRDLRRDLGRRLEADTARATQAAAA